LGVTKVTETSQIMSRIIRRWLAEKVAIFLDANDRSVSSSISDRTVI